MGRTMSVHFVRVADPEGGRRTFCATKNEPRFLDSLIPGIRT